MNADVTRCNNAADFRSIRVVFGRKHFVKNASTSFYFRCGTDLHCGSPRLDAPAAAND